LLPDDYKRRYDAFRGQLQYEDTLFNQRITWVIAFQALISFPFMFLSVSELQAQKPKAPQFEPGDEIAIGNYRLGLVMAGLFAGAFGYVGCAAAHWRIRQLKRSFKEDNQWGLPELDSPPKVRLAGAIASQGFLWGFFFLWTVVIFSDPRCFSVVGWVVALTLYIGATASQLKSNPKTGQPDKV
jgi:hypothetical protein